MIDTAWCYLNLNNPVCAWAAYRGFLVQTPDQPGFLSVWVASMFCASDPNRIAREFALEAVRTTRYPQAVSRLHGMYVFTDLDSAYRASHWGAHFVSENLAQLSLAEASIGEVRHDANWITYPDQSNWMDLYWSGHPHPAHEPVWESLAEGRLMILGTEQREAARSILEKAFPRSILLFETARIAAQVGSNLGNISAFLRLQPPMISLEYYLDMQESDDATLIERIVKLGESGHPINPLFFEGLKDLNNSITPDLSRFGFTRHISDMPYILSDTPP